MVVTLERSRNASLPIQRGVRSVDAAKRCASSRAAACKGTVTLTGSSQRPTDRLLHEVALFAGGTFDEAQPAQKRLVTGRFVMACNAGQERKSRALVELRARLAALRDLHERMWRAIEKVKASRVADRPVIETLRPSDPSAPA